ncbi:uncharacterized protein BDR25DRAFT_396177 [Lindgomyces ingoldianus]|uniref:Uncharacterized protein n=1 Tax=Lindgomyces ingoldianus TaxID=673940 RepID=A0ACB6QG42_9PLEO|nr:uncharacterized protein BDR25DRAFT_396177 [Lindgomyces ingoldianus]KAF2465475.1 hypothetical protein BDR25DRAFT_396177 [Lindgomyces ingoldianus]
MAWREEVNVGVANPGMRPVVAGRLWQQSNLIPPRGQGAVTMGINGIYKEIGPGQRIALSKLAVEKFEETGRPLRIAIDVSIWLFQIQASKGMHEYHFSGTNPALRTFFYRLLRLISLSIHPIFVFDGPNKPPFKRNKRTGRNVASIPEFLAKQLLNQFGFPVHRAPGEAEAECALLQREGIVDAVLSEDVDTLMFGSGVTIRNWSPELKTSTTPTHVNVYDAIKTKHGPSGLDREGMILVALMSGGDYVPEGIPGCGPKTACEAARAGFGRDLCNVAKNDAIAMKSWRDRLQHELKTNESKFFKTKHKSLVIPDDFPRADILGYYTHPAISNKAGLDKLRRSIEWDQDFDFPGLRRFTNDAFDWAKLGGAKHFIRNLAPVLLVRHLRMRGEGGGSTLDDLTSVQDEEAQLVKGIHGKRQHSVTDNTPELRVSFIPLDLVNIDLDKEDPDDDLPESTSDDETPLDIEDGEPDTAAKKRGPTKFDPSKPLRVWVMETYVKVGVPLKVQDWEAAWVKPKRAATTKDATKPAPKTKGAKRANTTCSMAGGAIEQYAKVTKPGIKLCQVLANAQNKAGRTPMVRGGSIPTLRSRGLPAASGSSNRTIIDLLSSSPAKLSAAPPTRQGTEKSLAPVLELPPTVAKRRRGLLQRSQTPPASPSTLDRLSTPPPMNLIETLDLVSSPALPSPPQLPAKKVKTQVTRNPRTSRAVRLTSVLSSPGTRSKQTTLDVWSQSSSTTTPTKNTVATTPVGRAPVPAPPGLQPSCINIKTLDLTLSSPPKSPPTRSSRPINPRRTNLKASRPRPRLRSISSNISPSPTSTPSPTASHHSKVSRRTSPRLQKSSPLEIDTVDLTQFSPPSTSTIQPPPRTSNSLTKSTSTSFAFTKPAPLPSKTPPSHTPTLPVSPPQTSQPPTCSLNRSPRNHLISRPSNSSPAAWKQQQKKKRVIRLRESMAGSWAFVDADTVSSSPENVAGNNVGLKGRERRMWRESQIQVLDLS